MERKILRLTSYERVFLTIEYVLFRWNSWHFVRQENRFIFDYCFCTLRTQYTRWVTCVCIQYYTVCKYRGDFTVESSKNYCRWLIYRFVMRVNNASIRIWQVCSLRSLIIEIIGGIRWCRSWLFVVFKMKIFMIFRCEYFVIIYSFSPNVGTRITLKLEENHSSSHSCVYKQMQRSQQLSE